MSLKDIAAWNGYDQENTGTSCSSCGSSNEEQEPAPASCTDTPEEELVDPSSCAASCTAE